MPAPSRGGRPDVNNEYPNVASLRGIVEEQNEARISCSGSLLHMDADKVVILTAATAPTRGGRDFRGNHRFRWRVVRSEQSGRWVDDRRHLLRQWRSPDQLSREGRTLRDIRLWARRVLHQRREQPWRDDRGALGALEPVQIAPDPDYLSRVISSVSNPTQDLSFTAVGYGTGEKFPIPGEETGPADPSGTNTSKFLVRYIAEGLTYGAHNPVNDVLRLSMNIAKGENGTCNGDSGGPIFYEDPTLGRVQVSLVSGGDAPAEQRTRVRGSAVLKPSISSHAEWSRAT